MYKILIFVLLLPSCIKQDKQVTIKELILFGYSGFCDKDSSSRIFDSTQLNIIYYIEYQTGNPIKIAIKGFRHPREYFRLKSEDSICLMNITKSLPHLDRYEYYPKEHEMYDGLYFTLFYKTSDQKEHQIHYVPDHLPDNLKLIHEYLMREMHSRNRSSIGAFQFHTITSKVAGELFKRYPPPPKPTE